MTMRIFTAVAIVLLLCEPAIAAKKEAQPKGFVEVDFDSKPKGATVYVDGEFFCSPTPCSNVLKPGSHKVSMQADRYRIRISWLKLDVGSKVMWKLTKVFGWLAVQSDPPGLEVIVDGKRAGITPMAPEERQPGLYKVQIRKPVKGVMTKSVLVSSGKKTLLKFRLRDRPAVVKSGRVRVDGALSVAAVKNRAENAWPGARDCYDEYFIRAPKHDDIFDVKFMINAQGAVKDEMMASATLRDQDLEQCILDNFEELSFPPPADGKDCRVVYPLIFTPK
jgi:PEGA domain-containing protein